MNVFEDFTARVRAIAGAIAAGAPDGATSALDALVVEPPRDAAHGDMATNAAMVLAKPLGRKPRDIADAIAEELRKDADVASVDIAGPGFINLRLAPAYWYDALRGILQAGEGVGRAPTGDGPSINVEYVSANPTGPMHVGHCRGAVVGDAIANLIEATGQAVTREYYVNDAGAQVEVLARSAYLRYREALGEDIGEIPEGLYPGDYLRAVGEALKDRHGDALRDADEDVWLPVVKPLAVDMMLDSIREDLALLNIEHDVFASELSLQSGEDKVAAALDWLAERDLVYVGKLPPPKGKTPEDWEDREQTLFRSTAYGDDVDRAIRKSDGSYTYFASDIAYHFDKFRRGYAHMIDVFGADHGGYVKRMQAAVAAMTDGQGDLDVRLCHLVRLFRDGEPVKMSKRSGEFVTLRDVVDEVGADPIRFMMVFRKSEAPLDFDFAKVTEQSKDNPVFYVQYAHARCHSVLSLAGEALGEGGVPDDLSQAPMERLTDEGEMALIRHLSAFPRMVFRRCRGSRAAPDRLLFARSRFLVS